MTAEIVATKDFTTIDGAKVRVWHGRDEEYRPCTFYVARVAYPNGVGSVEGLDESFLPDKQSDEACRFFI
jgi:hypothetical protein